MGVQLRNEPASEKQDRYRIRILKFLGSQAVAQIELGDGVQTILERADGQKLKMPKLLIRGLLSDGVIEVPKGEGSSHVRLTREGLARLRALSATKGTTTTTTTATQPDTPCALRNDGSPIARLYSPKSPSKSWLSKEEYHAGERLRVDFEKSQVVKSLGINWNAIGMPKQDGGYRESEASDFADGARLRVARALNTVGPELSGVLLDVCCFLKGLEQVEADRQWPRRSAKLLLKVALSALDRHYNPPPVRRSTRLSVWQAD